MCVSPTWHLIATGNSLYILNKLFVAAWLNSSSLLHWDFIVFIVFLKKESNSDIQVWEWPRCLCCLGTNEAAEGFVQLVLVAFLCLRFSISLPLWFVFSFQQDQCFHKAIGEKCYSIIVLQGRSCVFDSWVLSEVIMRGTHCLCLRRENRVRIARSIKALPFRCSDGLTLGSNFKNLIELKWEISWNGTFSLEGWIGCEYISLFLLCWLRDLIKGQFPQWWPVPVSPATRCSGVARRETAGGATH